MKRIIELPCDVGDKAFWVSKDGIEEVIVDSFIVNTNLFANVSYYIGSEKLRRTLTPYKTLFFTKQEAEDYGNNLIHCLTEDQQHRNFKNKDMTNFEKIKTMTEEEFANWLCKCIIPEDKNEDIFLYGYGDFYYEEDIVKMLKEKCD